MGREETASKLPTLTGVLIGLVAGAAFYAIAEFWITGANEDPLPAVVLFFTITAPATFLMLAETDRLLKTAGAALLIAGFLMLPDYLMAKVVADKTDNLSAFPSLFWFMASRGLVVYLLIVLAKAALTEGPRLHYRAVFLHGLTVPLIFSGAKLFAGLALLLLFAWAALLKSMDIHFFSRLFQAPWFIFPFLGGIGGLSLTMMRGQQAALGALRFVLLLFCRIAMPITALFTATFLIVLLTNGLGPIFERPYPAALMTGLAFAGMLIFNGVYQNGEGGPPPLWLRLSVLVALVGFPVYAGLAVHALQLRIEDYGLTPPRIGGLVVSGLAAAYSVVCLAGLASELNWRARRWMAPVGPLNIAMAALWVVALTAMATPLANLWAISADSQYRRIAEARVPAADFDFGYLRFELGKHGEKALDRMAALEDHPEIDAIREGVARARAANSYWDYERTPIEAEDAEEREPGPMDLEFNPPGADIDAGPESEAPDEASRNGD